MNLELRQLTVFPADVTFESETVDSFEEAFEGLTFKEPMRFEINVQKIKEEYFCQGRAVTIVESECSRCLENYTYELKGELNFIIKTDEGKPILASDVTEDVIYLKPNEHVVDLTETVRQAFMLEIPLKPICSENCRGLCPSCGVNLNEETCGCSGDEIDERWEGLKDLLK
jgi:DUF177 domain-containing protein